MPVREKYSKNVGIWLGEARQPNEVLHMWNYPSLEARMKIHAAVAADPEWQGAHHIPTGKNRCAELADFCAAHWLVFRPPLTHAA